MLAEYTSPDLHNWDSKGVFMTMMWARFYECPDVFKMGAWWYLVIPRHMQPLEKFSISKAALSTS